MATPISSTMASSSHLMAGTACLTSDARPPRGSPCARISGTVRSSRPTSVACAGGRARGQRRHSAASSQVATPPPSGQRGGCRNGNQESRASRHPVTWPWHHAQPIHRVGGGVEQPRGRRLDMRSTPIRQSLDRPDVRRNGVLVHRHGPSPHTSPGSSARRRGPARRSGRSSARPRPWPADRLVGDGVGRTGCRSAG